MKCWEIIRWQYSPLHRLPLPLEKEEAESLARNIGLRFKIIESNEMSNPDFVANPPERCYYCKRELFSELKPIALAEGLKWIADGTNADDLSDFRPGRKASAEAGIRSPLLEAGLTKAEIRQLSHAKGLPTWDQPGFAVLWHHVFPTAFPSPP